MPKDFQRTMDSILSEFPQAQKFINDILVFTKGSEIDQIGTVEKVLQKLNKENMSSIVLHAHPISTKSEIRLWAHFTAYLST